ncbi:MAG: NAD-binding protein [Acidobacteriota bacterium]
MRSTPKRVVMMMTVVLTVIMVAASLYMILMVFVEGETRTFLEALEFAAETVTTTGYGADARWQSPILVLFVIFLQLVGVMLVYMVVPIFLIPALEERFEPRLPRRVKKSMRNHVAIYRYGPAVESLLGELDETDIPTVILEQDDEIARDLFDDDMSVIYDKTAADVLDDAELSRARALICNGTDEENVAAILTVRQQGFEGEVLALVREPEHRKAVLLAGANHAFTPRHMLANTLAARASHRISPRLSGLQQVGRNLLLTELRVEPDGPLVGKTLGETNIGRRTGSTVVAQWVGGKLDSPLTADTVLQPRGILVAVGDQHSLKQLEELVGGNGTFGRTGPFVVAGYGEVGRRLVELLREAGEEVVVMDRVAQDGVDVVGNVKNVDVLDQLDLDNAQGLIVALDSDSATLFAAVLAKDRAPDVPIIARVNEAANVDRIHRAGADFALSISQVAGQMLAQHLLGGDRFSLEPQLDVVRRDVSTDMVGKHPTQLRLRDRTGCSVVAVERGEEVIARYDDQFRFRAGDVVFYCGDHDAVARLT